MPQTSNTSLAEGTEPSTSAVDAKNTDVLIGVEAFVGAAQDNDFIRLYVRLHKTPPPKRPASSATTAEQLAQTLLLAYIQNHWKLHGESLMRLFSSTTPSVEVLLRQQVQGMLNAKDGARKAMALHKLFKLLINRKLDSMISQLPSVNTGSHEVNESFPGDIERLTRAIKVIYGAEVIIADDLHSMAEEPWDPASAKSVAGRLQLKFLGESLKTYNALRAPMRTHAMRFLCASPAFETSCKRRSFKPTSPSATAGGHAPQAAEQQEGAPGATSAEQQEVVTSAEQQEGALSATPAEQQGGAMSGTSAEQQEEAQGAAACVAAGATPAKQQEGATGATSAVQQEGAQGATAGVTAGATPAEQQEGATGATSAVQQEGAQGATAGVTAGAASAEQQEEAPGVTSAVQQEGAQGATSAEQQEGAPGATAGATLAEQQEGALGATAAVAADATPAQQEGEAPKASLAEQQESALGAISAEQQGGDLGATSAEQHLQAAGQQEGTPGATLAEQEGALGETSDSTVSMPPGVNTGEPSMKTMVFNSTAPSIPERPHNGIQDVGLEEESVAAESSFGPPPTLKHDGNTMDFPASQDGA
ncbi:hypothetical protein DUNSADRAFT_17876 [Dunaliella salina]|uniref:Uncharacterized protein n=1 Tax=Dunaliella salina TaxID=3046 RepID=A0ABQ7G0Z0_DUNSA|nr:hypothetical protein DUNSADRAFT_17876 [Dunaliella salina]KAF5828269.1 hypothetical protein DUNSADRAFT_17876 [Dunaliella salina]|eukprot:KAF5828268.1 hypothetical protein DUNSADRAFT_17876 [Dunaliella salina]